MSDYDWRRIDDIPSGTQFADKFGRLFTKESPGITNCHGEYSDDGYWSDDFDTSRTYFEADDDELEDCDVGDAWPYYRVGGMSDDH